MYFLSTFFVALNIELTLLDTYLQFIQKRLHHDNICVLNCYLSSFSHLFIPQYCVLLYISPPFLFLSGFRCVTFQTTILLLNFFSISSTGFPSGYASLVYYVAYIAQCHKCTMLSWQNGPDGAS